MSDILFKIIWDREKEMGWGYKWNKLDHKFTPIEAGWCVHGDLLHCKSKRNSGWGL